MNKGDWIINNDGNYEKLDYNIYGGWNYGGQRAIDLTDDLLIKIGFIKSDESYQHPDIDLTIREVSEDHPGRGNQRSAGKWQTLGKHTKDGKTRTIFWYIHALHELQGIYRDLTGKEIEISF